MELRARRVVGAVNLGVTIDTTPAHQARVSCAFRRCAGLTSRREQLSRMAFGRVTLMAEKRR